MFSINKFSFWNLQKSTLGARLYQFMILESDCQPFLSLTFNSCMSTDVLVSLLRLHSSAQQCQCRDAATLESVAAVEAEPWRIGANNPLGVKCSLSGDLGLITFTTGWVIIKQGYPLYFVSFTRVYLLCILLWVEATQALHWSNTVEKMSAPWTWNYQPPGQKKPLFKNKFSGLRYSGTATESSPQKWVQWTI